jgi:copper(I)-binding protein
MLMGLKAPLEVGTEITITLTFKNAGDVEVTVPVLEEAP